MYGPIGVVDANEKDCEKLCAVLRRNNYQAIPLHSLESLEEYMDRGTLQVVILDLDTLPVDNRFFMEFSLKNPGLPIMALSSRAFHPELEEAMSHHISACLAKPPNPDELIYCVRSFCSNGLPAGEEPKKEGDFDHGD